MKRKRRKSRIPSRRSLVDPLDEAMSCWIKINAVAVLLQSCDSAHDLHPRTLSGVGEIILAEATTLYDLLKRMQRRIKSA